MDQIVTWLSQYSAPIVLLLAFGAALVYIVQQAASHAIASQFASQQKRIDLLLTRRSQFEERVMIDQYEMVKDLEMRLSGIGADLNRLRSGHTVEGFTAGREIVPLTKVFVDLQARRFLLKEDLYQLLEAQATALLDAANATTSEAAQHFAQRYNAIGDDLRLEMNRVFGIDKISWGLLDLDEQQHVPTRSRHS